MTLIKTYRFPLPRQTTSGQVAGMTEGDGQFFRKLLTNPSGELQCFDCAQHRHVSFDKASDFAKATPDKSQGKQDTKGVSKSRNLFGRAEDYIEKG